MSLLDFCYDANVYVHINPVSNRNNQIFMERFFFEFLIVVKNHFQKGMKNFWNHHLYRLISY